MGSTKDMIDRTVLAVGQKSGTAPQTQVGTQTATEHGTPTSINRPRIKGLLEDMTLETISQKIKERVKELKGQSPNSDPLDALVNIEDVMDVDHTAGMPMKKNSNLM